MDERDNVENFYRSPRLSEIPTIVAVEDSASFRREEAQQLLVVGFLAAIFREDPNRWKRIARPSEEMQTSISAALLSAGHEKDFDLAIVGWRRNELSARARLMASPIDKSELQNVRDIIVSWGAAFATGDKAYVEKIIRFLGRGSRSSVQPPQAFLGVQRTYVTRYCYSQADCSYVVPRKPIRPPPKREEVEFLTFGWAVWSLNEFAKRHAFVADARDAAIAADPDGPLARILRADTYRREHNVVAEAKGSLVDVLLSGILRDEMTPDLRLFDQIRAEPRGFVNTFAKTDTVRLLAMVRVKQQVSPSVVFDVQPPEGPAFRVIPEPETGTANPLGAVYKAELDSDQLTSLGEYIVRARVTAGNDSILTSFRFLYGSP